MKVGRRQEYGEAEKREAPLSLWSSSRVKATGQVTGLLLSLLLECPTPTLAHSPIFLGNTYTKSARFYQWLFVAVLSHFLV